MASKSRILFQVFITTVILLSIPYSAQAQVSLGGTPPSFSRVYLDIPQITTGSIDITSLLAEDELESKMAVPFRFGTPFDINLNLENSGIWHTQADGSRIWRLQINSPGALSINILYDDFQLPDGALFYIYSVDRSTVIGAFSSQNNKEHHEFATAPIKGESCILEYYLPANVEVTGSLSIWRIVHGYKDIFGWSQENGARNYGQSGSCNNNVNCPEGASWQDEKRGVAMTLLGNGTRWCTGSMINNVREDLTPYFLTANHCLGGETNWIFMFNYESPGCVNQNGPTWMTVQGSVLKAFSGNSDFALLEINETPPDSYNVYYNGWSNESAGAPNVIGIHHPSGDIKKISFENNPVTSNGNYWRVNDWDDGTTEPGSSGSPLFDNNHRIVGQLYGGTAACSGSINVGWDEYGKVAVSWNGASSATRLNDWLDPDNTGATTLDGIDPNAASFTAIPTIGWVPFDVDFSGSSRLTIDSWDWAFGDGGNSVAQSPTHSYTTAGLYDVTLEAISVDDDTLLRTKPNYIAALADSLIADSVAGDPGTTVVIPIYANNHVPVDYFKIPFKYSGTLSITYDSFSTDGLRTSYFTDKTFIHTNTGAKERTLRLRTAVTNGTVPELPPGTGIIVNLYFTIAPGGNGTQETIINLNGYSTYEPFWYGSVVDFLPRITDGKVIIDICCIVRGDFNHSGEVNISDITGMVDYMFKGGPEPFCVDEANANTFGDFDIADLTYLVDYMFREGPAPFPCF